MTELIKVFKCKDLLATTNSMDSQPIPDCSTKSVLVLGCGNILFGDDGFGPKVIEYFENNYCLPEYVEIVNAGSGVRNILFDIALSEEKPAKIIIVDALDCGRLPGEVFELPLENLPVNKIDDFSMHQLPTSNLLRELQNLSKVEISIVAAQVQNIPETVSPGLSETLVKAIPEACRLIIKKIGE